MCFVFGQTYKGFCPESQPHLSDSELAVLSRSDDESELEDDNTSMDKERTAFEGF